MSEYESWQVKRYYRPRVLIPYADLVDPPLPEMTIVCLTASELVLLRNVLDYCHRRSTFVVTYGTDFYVAPGHVEWDAIESMVAELEGKLMSGCEDLLEKLDDLIASELTRNGYLDVMATSLGGLDTTLALILEGLSSIDETLATGNSSLACICSALQVMKQDPAIRKQVETYVDDETLQVDDPYPGQETPGVGSDACAIAQLTYHFAYEFISEVVQPAQEKAVQVLLPMAMAVIASWIGTPLLGLPVGAILALLWNVIEVWVDGSLAGVLNSLWTNKDEIICAAYPELAATSNYGAAAADVRAAIDEIQDLSPVDKLVMYGLTAPWVMSRMAVAWENQTSWATARVVGGFCESCGAIVGSNWFALPVPDDENLRFLEYYPPDTGWKYYCFYQNIPSGFEYAGLFFEVIEKTGNTSVRYSNALTCPDAEATLTADNSPDLAAGWYFLFDQYEFNEAECKAAIRPDAIQITNGAIKCTGPKYASDKWRLGWTGSTGEATIRFRYMVYKGSPPW